MSENPKVTRAELETDPNTLWNTFVNLLAMRDYDDLKPSQRPAHLAFWYDSEVQNGGHFQYFENRGVEQVDETIRALESLGATAQSKILSSAFAIASQREWGAISSVDEFVEKALASPFSQLDRAYYECQPALLDLLQRHLASDPSRYVTLVEPPR